MKKGLLAGIITLVAIIAVAGIVIYNNSESEKQQTSSVDESHAGGDENHDESHEDEAAAKQTTTQSTDSQATDVKSEEVNIDIKNFEYSEKTLKIKKGTKVTWTNRDSQKHDVMPDNPSDSFKASELLANGDSYSFTFETVGTYSYFCSPHPYMKASIEVVE